MNLEKQTEKLLGSNLDLANFRRFQLSRINFLPNTMGSNMIHFIFDIFVQ